MLLLPALAAWAMSLSGATPMTKLTVVVTSEGGRPVDRAGVRVVFVEGRSYVKLGKKIKTSWELRTNQEGQAKIPAIPQGKIMIQVYARNYQTYGQTFEVDQEEKTIEIKLNPPQSQYSAH
jgi:hypothetical protein